MTQLRQRFGQASFEGPQSLFGILASKGWTIFPNKPGENEHSSYNGGYIVRTYGSQHAHGIDAIQLEFGSKYRDKKQRHETAETLAAAVEEYVAMYLRSR